MKYLWHFLMMTVLLAPVGVLQAEETAAPAKAVYYAIPEPFTINFLNQSKQKARYLQIKVTLMAHDPDVIENAKANLPMIQDALLTLFSEQNYDTVNSVKGRKILQQKATDLVKSILQEETGNDKLDAVYFTSFILQ